MLKCLMRLNVFSKRSSSSPGRRKGFQKTGKNPCVQYDTEIRSSTSCICTIECIFFFFVNIHQDLVRQFHLCAGGRAQPVARCGESFCRFMTSHASRLNGENLQQKMNSPDSGESSVYTIKMLISSNYCIYYHITSLREDLIMCVSVIEYTGHQDSSSFLQCGITKNDQHPSRVGPFIG